MSIKTGQGQF